MKRYSKLAALWILAGLLVPLAAPGTERISLNGLGFGADGESFLSDITPDGKYVVFESDAEDLVASDNNGYNDVFVYDTVNATITLVSLANNGQQGNERSSSGTISNDGRYVCFQSLATNLISTTDGNGVSDVFVRDTMLNTTIRISSTPADGDSNGPSAAGRISGDGSRVAYLSSATNLVTGDPDGNGVSDVFVRDRSNPMSTVRASIGLLGMDGNGAASYPDISDDGSRVSFLSEADNLVNGDTNAARDVFLRDFSGPTTTRVSLARAGGQISGPSESPVISGDGNFIAFGCLAPNVVPGETNIFWDTFVRNLSGATTELISVSSSGSQGNRGGEFPSISQDGRYVAFQSESTNLDVLDTSTRIDLFVRDRQNGTTRRISVADDGSEANDINYAFPGAQVALDGSLAFQSAATNLVPVDLNGEHDVFLGTATPPLPPEYAGLVAQKRALVAKLKRLKKQLKKAKRSKNRAKTKRIKKLISKTTKQIRALGV